MAGDGVHVRSLEHVWKCVAATFCSMGVRGSPATRNEGRSPCSDNTCIICYVLQWLSRSRVVLCARVQQFQIGWRVRSASATSLPTQVGKTVCHAANPEERARTREVTLCWRCIRTTSDRDVHLSVGALLTDRKIASDLLFLFEVCRTSSVGCFSVAGGFATPRSCWEVTGLRPARTCRISSR